jgi:hypothetical protein
MRQRLRQQMIETRDTGVVPEAMWKELAAGGTIHAAVRAPGFDHAALVDLAFAATAPGAALPESAKAALSAPCPVARYWAATGCLIRGRSAAPFAADLERLAADPSAAVRQAATAALAAIR